MHVRTFTVISLARRLRSTTTTVSPAVAKLSYRGYTTCALLAATVTVSCRVVIHTQAYVSYPPRHQSLRPTPTPWSY